MIRRFKKADEMGMEANVMSLPSEKSGRENYLKRLPNRWHTKESWISLKIGLPSLKSWSRGMRFLEERISGLS